MPLAHTIIGIQRKYERKVCNAVFMVLKACTLFVLICWFFSGHVGAESLSFRYRLTDLPAKIDLSMGYWQLPGGNEHQNTVLKLYQDVLRQKGITDENVLHYASAILVSENEPLTVDRLGDHGKSFGICQRNVGNAAKFMQDHHDEASLEGQIDYCAERFAEAYARYGNVFQATVSHNCPSCAARNQDAWHLKPSYFTRVTNATYKLALL